jgi:hypothetical protein
MLKMCGNKSVAEPGVVPPFSDGESIHRQGGVIFEKCIQDV